MSVDNEDLSQDVAELRDALDHIWRTARSSRTQTRRLRWIAARALSAIEGNNDWQDLDAPKVVARKFALREISAFIEKHLGDTAMAHLVMPDPRADRVPWIEVRCCTTMPVELEEEIETAWPDIEFELVYTDEDGL